MFESECSAVVVGAGIGGLTTATALSAAGFDVMVLERAEELREIGAAIGVQTNAIRALRGLGLADAVLEKGIGIEFYEYCSWNGKRLARWSQGEIGRKLGEPTVVVHRADLQKVLFEAAPQHAIALGAKCVSVAQDADGVVVQLAGGERIRARILIGADGLNSLVRGAAVGNDDLRYSGWVAYRGVTDFSTSNFPIGYARQILGAGRSFGMWHIRDGRIYWVATIKEPAEEQIRPIGRKNYILEQFRGAMKPVADVVGSTDPEAILRNAVSDRRPVATWSAGRITLVGDAAHPTTPVTGQGGGQAIIDASVLATELAGVDLSDAAAVRAAFLAYEQRRRPVTTSITDEAWRIAAMHHFRNPLAVWARDRSLQWTPTGVWNRRMEERLGF